jgi:chromosome partitioning protein
VKDRVMLVQANNSATRSTYVIVVGNEKGGSGKSTLAIHVAIALMKAGQRVATIDLDSRQQSFTHYVENRRAWSTRHKLDLDIPTHCFVARSEGIRNDENERAEFDRFIERIAAVEDVHDFVVIDTPGSDSYLMRLAHAMADTLITPLNDSFVDFDVLGAVDPVTFALTQSSHYAEMVREARRARRAVNRNDLDWVLVRNRLASMHSRNREHLADGLGTLGLQLGFRCANGFTERNAYREFFPRGLTALDTSQAAPGWRPSRSQVMAGEEVHALLAALRLPIDEKGWRRAAIRSEWFASGDRPTEADDTLDDVLASPPTQPVS